MSARQSYPAWWPAVLWFGVTTVAVVSAFPDVVEPLIRASGPRSASLSTYGASKGAEAPVEPSEADYRPSPVVRCERDAFGRCVE